MELIQFRPFLFIMTFLIFWSLEHFFLYRKWRLTRKQRWPGNFGLIVLNSLILKFALPMTSLQFAEYVQEKELSILFSHSFPMKEVFLFFMLDLAIYIQHVLTHKVPLFWRFHKVHHIDSDLDVTSGFRFHPIEIFFSQIYKMGWILLLGPSVMTVFLFEVFLNSLAMFNHSNFYIPPAIEKTLRWVLVTPQMHIIHHSVEQSESDTNYGFQLSVWDRIFGTYTDEFKSTGVIGQKGHEKAEDQNIINLLLGPFKNKSS